MISWSERVDKVAAMFAMIWLMLTIDACFTWFMPWPIRNFLGFISVLFGTVILISNTGVVFSRQRNVLLLSLFVLSLFIFLTKFDIFLLFIYFPLMLVVCWRDSALRQMYVYFRIFVLFYAILSIFVEILVVTGFWPSLPCLYIFPAQDFVQENNGVVNYFYGLFCIPATDTSLSFYRACGPLREGGHFVFFLGFIYFTEMALRNKRNIWLIICGILTLSPNFILIFLLTESYLAIKQKRIMKPLLSIMGVLVVIVVLFVIAPQDIQDDIIGIFYERILEKSLQNVEGDGWMAILDGRTTEYSFKAYDQFLQSGLNTRLFGMKAFDGEDIMSDFRFLLMYVGFVGTTLIAWCTIAFSFINTRNLYTVSVFIIAFAIFMQRAWMFNQVYFWVIIYLITNENINDLQKKIPCPKH